MCGAAPAVPRPASEWLPLGSPTAQEWTPINGLPGGTQAGYRCPGTTPIISPGAVSGPHLAHLAAPGGLDCLLSHLGCYWPRGQVQSPAYKSPVPRGRAPRPRLSLSPPDTHLLGAVYAALPRLDGQPRWEQGLPSAPLPAPVPVPPAVFLAGKNVKVKVWVAQLRLTLCDPTGCPPGSSVHGILQARILEWVAFPVSRGFFPSRGSNLGFLHSRQILYHLSHWGSLV